MPAILFQNLLLCRSSFFPALVMTVTSIHFVYQYRDGQAELAWVVD